MASQAPSCSSRETEELQFGLLPCWLVSLRREMLRASETHLGACMWGQS